MWSLNFIIHIIIPATLWPVVDSSCNRNDYQVYSWGIKHGQCIRLILPPFVDRLSRKCGNLDVSQPRRPSHPVTGLLFVCIYMISLFSEWSDS
jgi:hypothetical protein